jgi:SRSO17 transposase
LNYPTQYNTVSDEITDYKDRLDFSMQVPIVAPSPIVAKHSQAFRDLFENHCQFEHFQNYLTALMVLENKSLSNISRCVLASADKTNLSRFFSQAPWREAEVNERRLEYLLEHTAKHRRASKDSCLLLDDTLCEHVGSLFEYVARHYDHSQGRYPLAHNLVTSHLVSGAVRFPVDARLYRRYEERTNWEFFVHKHFGEIEIPTRSKERNKFHKEVEGKLLLDAEFARLHEEFETKIKLAVQLIEAAVKRQLPVKIVLMDSWYLAPLVLECLQKQELDWVSLLKKNRKIETASFTLREATGKKIEFSGAHIKVEELVKLIPRSAFKSVKVGEREYWYFAINVGIPDLGKVRLVISYDNAKLEGTCAALVSNRTDWSAKKIIESYLQRWPIETFYQDSKGHLGLDEYRMRGAEAAKKHWCLVFVAYSFLHLDCLEASPKKRQALLRPIKTIGEACRQQGQALLENLILKAHNLIQQGESVSATLAQLFAKQQPSMAG